MKVYGKCKNCTTEIAYRTDAHTRVGFAMQDGENITVKCKNCGTENKFHVDELYANQSKLAILVSGLILLIGTPLTFFLVNPIFQSSRNHYVIYIVGGFLLVPIFIYAVMNRQEMKRVSDFNRRKLKGRIHNVA